MKPGQVLHLCIDINAPWQQVRKWEPRHNDGRRISSWEWEEIRAAAKARGWEAIPTCDNPDDKGRCAGCPPAAREAGG